MVMLSMRDCLTSCLSCKESLAQCPVIFLRRSTAASWRTLGVLAVRRCWTSAGTTCGSLARRFICSSAWRRASLSGIRNCMSRSSNDCAILLWLFWDVNCDDGGGGCYVCVRCVRVFGFWFWFWFCFVFKVVGEECVVVLVLGFCSV